MLAFTTLFAVGLLPLTIPSYWWVYVLPVAVCLLSVYVISRFDLSPARGQVFWLSLLVGGHAYLACTAFISMLTVWQDIGGDLWFEILGPRLWELMHGEKEDNGGVLGFFISLHIIAAFAVAAVPAYVAQLFAESCCRKARETL
jgi:hypothetical protein